VIAATNRDARKGVNDRTRAAVLGSKRGIIS
jgi:hypothetical protein